MFTRGRGLLKTKHQNEKFERKKMAQAVPQFHAGSECPIDSSGRGRAKKARMLVHIHLKSGRAPLKNQRASRICQVLYIPGVEPSGYGRSSR